MPNAPAKLTKPGAMVQALTGWRERLVEELERKGKSWRGASLESGLSSAAVRVMVTGTGEVYLRSLVQICEAAGCDLTYVITGSRMMSISGPDEALRLGHLNGVAVPIVPLTAAMSSVPSDAPLIVLQHRRLKKPKAGRVVDRSMERELFEGDILIYTPEIEPQHGDYAIVSIHGGAPPTARIYEPTYNAKGVIARARLVPVNKSWPAIELATKDFAILGKVVEVHRQFN